jgi:hypothetical protein
MPNVKEGGVTFGTAAAELKELPPVCERSQKTSDCQAFTNVTDIADIAAA